MSSKNILVIEDELIVARTIQIHLQRLGYEVPAIATTGEEAIRMADEIRPDLILMDIQLQGAVDGIDAARRIREIYRVPIVYLSASSDPSTRVRMKITEPAGLLIKPYKEGELNTVIEIALYKHEMEGKLRESQEWLAVTLNSISDATIATSPEGIVRVMNPVSETMLGWNRSEALGRPIGDVIQVVGDPYNPWIGLLIDRAIREDCVIRSERLARLRTRDGREVIVEDTAAPIRNDKKQILGVVLTFRDVSEKIKVEEELKESERRFRIMADTAPVMLWMAGTDSLCSFFNKPWLEFRGRRIEQERGNGWAEGIHPEDFLRTMHVYLSAFVARKEFRMEYRLMRQDREYRWILDTGVPRFSPGGLFEGYIGSCIDITDRKIAEDQLQRAHEELKRSIDPTRVSGPTRS